MDEFTLYLMSDSSKTYFPLTCAKLFTVKLDKAISFQNYADWELAMLDIVYPSSICTLNGEQVIILDENEHVQSSFRYPSIQCTSLPELIAQLNSVNNGKYFQVGMEQHHRIKLTVFAPYTIVFEQALSDILCLDQSLIPHHATPIISSDTPSLTRHVDYLYVYTNIGQYVLVGDVQAPLLRYFPFSSSSSQKFKTFVKRLFVALNQSQIEHIEVSIRDGAGELVPFSDSNATTQLTLQFRRRH